MRSLFDVSQLKKQDIESLYFLFKSFKDGFTENLEAKAALLFLESSTRTRFSFQLACENLGIKTFYAGRGETSIEKGESFLDTLYTLKALGFDLVIFRLPFVVFPYEPYNSLDLCLINAGDGTHQHPTQGLLDLFTLMERFESLEGLKVLFVGDILHSRVFRSSSLLLGMYGAKIGVCGPRSLIPKDLTPFNVERVFSDVDQALDWADVVIYLRLQEERFKENFIPSKESYFLQFGLTKERHERVKTYFMHPGPVNVYVDIDRDVMYSEKSLILKQVENGIYTRMAVIHYLLK